MNQIVVLQIPFQNTCEFDPSEVTYKADKLKKNIVAVNKAYEKVAGELMVVVEVVVLTPAVMRALVVVMVVNAAMEVKVEAHDGDAA